MARFLSWILKESPEKNLDNGRKTAYHSRVQRLRSAGSPDGVPGQVSAGAAPEAAGGRGSV